MLNARFYRRSYPYYYYDPLLLEVECGKDTSKDSAIAALLAVSSLLKRERMASLGRIVFGIFFIVISSSIVFFVRSFLVGAPLVFLVVPIVFAVLGVLFVVFSVIRFVKYSNMAAQLADLARMVRIGLLKPEEVCSKNVQALIELYKIKKYSSNYSY